MYLAKQELALRGSFLPDPPTPHPPHVCLQVVDYFEKFELSAFESDCALVLQLRLNKEFVDATTVDPLSLDFGSPAPNDVVCLHPSLEDVQAQACVFIDHMVGMGQRFPRVDARVATHFPLRQRPTEHLGPATVTLDDEIVQQVRR